MTCRQAGYSIVEFGHFGDVRWVQERSGDHVGELAEGGVIKSAAGQCRGAEEKAVLPRGVRPDAERTKTLPGPSGVQHGMREIDEHERRLGRAGDHPGTGLGHVIGEEPPGEDPGTAERAFLPVPERRRRGPAKGDRLRREELPRQPAPPRRRGGGKVEPGRGQPVRNERCGPVGREGQGAGCCGEASGAPPAEAPLTCAAFSSRRRRSSSRSRRDGGRRVHRRPGGPEAGTCCGRPSSGGRPPHSGLRPRLGGVRVDRV